MTANCFALSLVACEPGFVESLIISEPMYSDCPSWCDDTRMGNVRIHPAKQVQVSFTIQGRYIKCPIHPHTAYGHWW